MKIESELLIYQFEFEYQVNMLLGCYKWFTPHNQSLDLFLIIWKVNNTSIKRNSRKGLLLIQLSFFFFLKKMVFTSKKALIKVFMSKLKMPRMGLTEGDLDLFTSLGLW